MALAKIGKIGAEEPLLAFVANLGLVLDLLLAK